MFYFSLAQNTIPVYIARAIVVGTNKYAISAIYRVFSFSVEGPKVQR